MKVLLTALVIITSLPLFSQTSDSSAKCVAYWRNGEKKIYNARFSYKAHITVLDFSASGYTVPCK